MPKALMPLGDSVYLDCLLEKVLNYNASHVYLSLHYKPELFQKYVESSIYIHNLTNIIEPKPLGTGGAVNYVIQNSNISSPFFVINADSLSDINLDQYFEEYVNSDLKAMVGISEVVNAERYGTVIVDDGKVLSFIEKGIIGNGWINNGHYIFKKEVFEGFSGAFSLEKHLLPTLVENQGLGAFRVKNDNFIDMGIPDDYKKLNKIFMDGE